ncbi:hypothetical protein F5148DRAFT_905303 [Russula earlei]|uniref:Uncharacterized protein n=1 Tax=Russula earlei TaxID=71964 RepID=A0ACC0UC69_9AGAM|nr:hypothetical protein F5148DRAFT_905303 [Russula earlei]
MSIPPDPPWKKRTRPCPFYSQGRCVFAESCGFLHDAKIKSSVNRELASSCLDAGSSRDSSSSMGTMIVKPLNAVVAYSPSSLSPSSRSPRMASLLSALQNIIGPPSPNSAEFSLPQEDIPSTDASDVSHLPHEATQCTDRDCRGNLELEDVSRADVANATSPAVNDDMPEAPQPDSVTPPCLLSPVQIGSVPPVPFPHTASLGGVSLSRGDSIDSGYAETWIDPTPFSLSPPQSDRRSSTLDLLFFAVRITFVSRVAKTVSFFPYSAIH